MPKATAELCSRDGTVKEGLMTPILFLEPLPPSFSADITRLLSTNDAPVDAEIIIVRQIILDAEARLRALDGQAVYYHLLTTTAQIEEHLRQHRAILSAVRRIPAELICEIFDLATAQSRAGPRGKPPWRLGWICRPWRKYALDNPPLWSSLIIPACTSVSATREAQLRGCISRIWWEYVLDYLPLWSSFAIPTYASPARNRGITSLLARLEIQLLRSAAASLDIHWLRVTGYSPDSRILNLVLPHSNRWRAVSFSIVSGKSVVNWLEPVRGKLDHLLKLEFANVAHEISFSDVFMTAPDLRQVVFDEGVDPYATASIPIPWGQITHYGGPCSFAHQIPILEVASNLSNCALDMRRNVISAADTNAPVILPELRRLYLTRSASNFIL
ncbi:hypothetical protein C8R45DRAFT_569668 [Mycena sanguinolenta]|nr:hypothetical protein C8R45DRAFT_569668 [Mycena sanguinolenta]